MREAPPGVCRAGKKRRKPRPCGCLLRAVAVLALAAVLIFLGFGLLQGTRGQLLRVRYPIKYQEYVEEYAEEFQLEPALVYAIIRTESRFDPYAVSTAGAKGLMQLLDETARDCARELKIEAPEPEALFEPQTNIRLGCCYLQKLLRTYHGDLETAVAAYNGGPGNVEKWLKDQSLIDERGVLVRVPFPETRNYVERVMKALDVYRGRI